MTWLVPRELKTLGTESWLSPFLLAQVSFNVSDLLTTVQWCTMNTSGQHSFPKKREWSKSKAIHRMLEDGLERKASSQIGPRASSCRIPTYLPRKKGRCGLPADSRTDSGVLRSMWRFNDFHIFHPTCGQQPNSHWSFSSWTLFHAVPSGHEEAHWLHWHTAAAGWWPCPNTVPKGPVGQFGNLVCN